MVLIAMNRFRQSQWCDSQIYINWCGEARGASSIPTVGHVYMFCKYFSTSGCGGTVVCVVSGNNDPVIRSVVAGCYFYNRVFWSESLTSET